MTAQTCCGGSGSNQPASHSGEAMECAICDSRFHLMRNRYVCKACLRIVCSRCSPFRKAVDLTTGIVKEDGDVVFRVCRECKDRGHGKRPILTTKAAKKAQCDPFLKKHKRSRSRRSSFTTKSSTESKKSTVASSSRLSPIELSALEYTSRHSSRYRGNSAGSGGSYGRAYTQHATNYSKTWYKSPKKTAESRYSEKLYVHQSSRNRFVLIESACVVLQNFHAVTNFVFAIL